MIAGVPQSTVPDVMHGCWSRAWIEFADGSIDSTSRVLWLQTPSLMVDVRVAADRPHLVHRAGLADCTLDELRVLARADGSSGFTEADPVMVDSNGARTTTACWHTRGHGVNFQPVSAYPEPGLMSWSDDGTVMLERAPSGAYVERWELVPGSREPLSVTTHADRIVYRAGDIAVCVRDRQVPVPRAARLPELLEEYVDDRVVIEALLDCEFSIAERDGDEWVITTSTLPWRQGQVLDVDLR